MQLNSINVIIHIYYVVSIQSWSPYITNRYTWLIPCSCNASGRHRHACKVEIISCSECQEYINCRTVRAQHRFRIRSCSCPWSTWYLVGPVNWSQTECDLVHKKIIRGSRSNTYNEELTICYHQVAISNFDVADFLTLSTWRRKCVSVTVQNYY